MAKTLYVGVNNTSQNIKDIYVGVDGVAKKVVAGYVGVNGVAQEFYTIAPTEVVLDYWTLDTSLTTLIETGV